MLKMEPAAPKHSRRGYKLTEKTKEVERRFQRKQNPTITQDKYEMLCSELERHGIRKEDITKDQIRTFLSKNDLYQHNNDINLIHTIMTGTPPPNNGICDTELDVLYDASLKAFESAEFDIDPQVENLKDIMLIE